MITAIVLAAALGLGPSGPNVGLPAMWPVDERMPRPDLSAAPSRCVEAHRTPLRGGARVIAGPASLELGEPVPSNEVCRRRARLR